MPSTKASDVAHAAQTDHRVLSSPSAFPLDQAHEPPSLTDLVVFDGAESRLPPEEIDRGKAILLANRPGATKIEDLDQILTKLLIPQEDLVDGVPFTIAAIAGDKAAMHSLGFAYLVNDQREKAIALWERILELDPEDESALALLFAQKLDLAPAEALKLSDRLLKVNPNVALSWGRRSYLLGQMGRNEEAIEAGEKALSLDPRLTQVYEWLAERYTQAGQTEKAQKHRQAYADFLKAAEALRLKANPSPDEPEKKP